MPLNDKTLLALLKQYEDRQGELEIFLQAHFGPPSQVIGSKEVEYGTLLALTYNKKNKIHKVKILDGDIKSSEFEQLEARLDSVFSQSAPLQVIRTLFVTSQRVSGYFRYEDDFQIIPVPEQAPQPEHLIAEYPFIIEYTVQPSDILPLFQHRKTTQHQELLLMLNLFCRHGVSDISGSWQWVFDTTNLAENGLVTKYLHTGYSYGQDSREKGEDGFTFVDDIPALRHIGLSSYWSVETTSFNFFIPGDLNDLIKRWKKHDNLKRFKIASYWLQVANNVRYISYSSAYTALISSIEALLPDTPQTKCECCGQQVRKPGPTKLFKDFLETYSYTSSNKERDKIYRIRSKISHGGDLFSSDWNSSSFRFNPEINDASQQLRRLFTIVRNAIINFFLEETNADEAE